MKYYYTLLVLIGLGLGSFGLYKSNITLRSPASAKEEIKEFTIKEFTFKYNTKAFQDNVERKYPEKEFSLTVEGSTYEEAFKLASSKCFKKLTGGTYPGESRGLDIIDICSNPR